MSAATGLGIAVHNTSGYWSEQVVADGVPRASDRMPENSAASTDLQSLDRFQVDVEQLGCRAALQSRPDGIDLRTQLASRILRSKYPSPRIRVVVNHCIARASQAVIEAGADVLARLGTRLADFIEHRDEDYDREGLADRIWLYSTAIAQADRTDAKLSARFIRELRAWLQIDDPFIRESVANAIGQIRATELRASLKTVRAQERNAIVREAIDDALTELR